MDKEQARYGWMRCSVKEMRRQFHNAVTEGGEFITVDIMRMLVWSAADQKVNFIDTFLISLSSFSSMSEKFTQNTYFKKSPIQINNTKYNYRYFDFLLPVLP